MLDPWDERSSLFRDLRMARAFELLACDCGKPDWLVEHMQRKQHLIMQFIAARVSEARFADLVSRARSQGPAEAIRIRERFAGFWSNASARKAT